MQIRTNQKKRHIWQIWEGPKHVASVHFSCGVRLHHLPATLMCNSAHSIVNQGSSLEL